LCDHIDFTPVVETQPFRDHLRACMKLGVYALLQSLSPSDRDIVRDLLVVLPQQQINDAFKLDDTTAQNHDTGLYNNIPSVDAMAEAVANCLKDPLYTGMLKHHYLATSLPVSVLDTTLLGSRGVGHSGTQAQPGEVVMMNLNPIPGALVSGFS